MSDGPPRWSRRGLALVGAALLIGIGVVVVPGAWVTIGLERERPRLPAGDAPAVVLAAAPVPFAGFFAEHGWFALRGADGRWHRWEVWQSPRAPLGHVWHNSGRRVALRNVSDGTLEGTRVIRAWSGADAAALAACIPRVSRGYRARDRYRYWPGPNSNTYIRAVLEACGQRGTELPATFVGAGWPLDR